VTEADRARQFRRFERGADRTADDGSGLGLYVSRELCRAMDGDLVLDAAASDRGAAFSVYLPGEPPDEDAGDRPARSEARDLGADPGT
jgi:signal transduction histidine kinase